MFGASSRLSQRGKGGVAIPVHGVRLGMSPLRGVSRNVAVPTFMSPQEMARGDKNTFVTPFRTVFFLHSPCTDTHAAPYRS